MEKMSLGSECLWAWGNLCWAWWVRSSLDHLEHSWRRGNKRQKTWQLEPLFLVFFLKSIIRNFRYRNSPSKPLEFCCSTGISHQIHQDTRQSGL